MTITTVTGCWTLTDPYDELALWDANCHTDSRAEAAAYQAKLIAKQSDDDVHDAREYTPYQAAGRCYTVSCDTCKAVYGDPRTAHFATVRDAIDTAVHDGEWAFTGGRWECPNCKK